MKYRWVYFLCTMLGTFSWLPMFPTIFVDGIKYALFLAVFWVGFFYGRGAWLKDSWFLLAYLGILSPSFIYGVIFYEVSIFLFFYLLVPFILHWSFCRVLCYSEVFTAIFRGFVFGGGVNSIGILASYYGGVNLAPESVVGTWSSYEYSVMGFANSHTMVSPLIGLSLGICLIGWRWVFKGWSKFLKYSLIAILLSGQLLSGGEGGIIVLFASLCAVVVIKSRNVNPVFIVFVGMLVTYFAVSHVGPMLSEELRSSFVEHQVANAAGFEMFYDNLIWGVGYNNSYDWFLNYIPSSFYSAVIYSESLTPHTPMGVLLAEFGLFGGVAFLILVLPISFSVKYIRSDSEAGEVVFFVIIYFLLLQFLEPWPFISNFFSLYILYASLARVRVKGGRFV